jgi:glucose-6-phosphate isomerase
MFPHVNPTTTASWNELAQHAERLKKSNLRELFQQDPERFQKWNRQLNDTLFDLSKNILDEQALNALLALAKECKVKEAIQAMFDGDFINETE